MEPPVHRPPGDLLQEILEKGAASFLRVASIYPSAPPACRVAVLIGGLSLGEEVDNQAHALLASQESAAKQGALLGLGCMGYPLAEGYLARILREKPSDDAVFAALRGLGQIRGPKSLPLVLAALDQPFFMPQACSALAEYRDPTAITALLGRFEEPPARQALAEIGAPEAADLFRPLLASSGPARIDAVRWVGVAADAESAPHLLPILASRDPPLARAACEAYAALGAPLGPQPLLDHTAPSPEPWMVEALARVDHPAVHGFLLTLLGESKPRSFFASLFRRTASRRVEARKVYRALRGASAPEVVALIAERLVGETDPVSLGEILENRAIVEGGRYASALLSVWRRESLIAQHLVARALVQSPTREFLAEALRIVSLSPFIPLDGASLAADPRRLIDGYARDQNICLLVGDFLESGLLDLESLDQTLCRRLSERAYTPSVRPSDRFTRPEDEGTPEFLAALADVNPTIARPVWSLWSLLAQVEQRGDPLLNLFLSWTGVHRGGLRRSLGRNLPGALGRFISGKDDKDLLELDAIAAQIPQQGLLARSLRETFGQARRALMAECRDMALMTEGQAKGDIVLIEEL